MMTTATALGITNWCLNCIGILIFLLIFIIIIKSSRELHTVSLVLTLNTSVSALLTCLTVWIMICSNLTTGFLTYNHNFCCAWGLLYDIFECSIYHSYCLQAIYRLCRVVFYKKRALLSFSLYIKLIFGQWILTIVVLLPPIVLNWYIRIPTEKYCLVPYTNLVAESYHIGILYIIPLICIGSTYVWITRFIRNSSNVSSHVLEIQQRKRNLRDLMIIKRIVILISILIVLRFPTVVFMIYAVIGGYLYPFTFGIVGIITSLCLIFIGLITIHITPELRKKLLIFLNYKDNQVHIQRTPNRGLMVPAPTNNRIDVVQQNESTMTSAAKRIKGTDIA